MDRIDRAIVRELQQNGRLTNQDLADRVGLSPSPCLRRVKRLEADGVIDGYAARVSQQRIGLPVTGFVFLKLNRHAPEAVEEVEAAIRGIDHVVEAYLMAGTADFLMRVVAESLESYESLVKQSISRIPHIASMETTFAVGTTKPASPYPTPRPIQ